jgi:prepilin-type N-terminal cleavage/methylation domain-containing protein/prepilin-type processing-associated H-X9-DG protein
MRHVSWYPLAAVAPHGYRRHLTCCSPTRLRSAFTLIELLVVVAIIAVLAAILFPVFSKAIERAKRVQCLNNLHQVGTALLVYTDDNDGRFPWAYCDNSVFLNPTRRSLKTCMQSYTGATTVWECPSDRGEVFMQDGSGLRHWPRPVYTLVGTSYDWPGIDNMNWRAYAGLPLNAVKRPPETPMVFEVRPWHGGYLPNQFVARNTGRYNVLYCDGHVTVALRDEWYWGVGMAFK